MIAFTFCRCVSTAQDLPPVGHAAPGQLLFPLLHRCGDSATAQGSSLGQWLQRVHSTLFWPARWEYELLFTSLSVTARLILANKRHIGISVYVCWCQAIWKPLFYVTNAENTCIYVSYVKNMYIFLIHVVYTVYGCICYQASITYLQYLGLLMTYHVQYVGWYIRIAIYLFLLPKICICIAPQKFI